MRLTLHVLPTTQQMVNSAEYNFHLLQRLARCFSDYNVAVYHDGEVEYGEHEERAPAEVLDRVWSDLGHHEIEKPLNYE